jgi:hypothetical protein
MEVSCSDAAISPQPLRARWAQVFDRTSGPVGGFEARAHPTAPPPIAALDPDWTPLRGGQRADFLMAPAAKPLLRRQRGSSKTRSFYNR